MTDDLAALRSQLQSAQEALGAANARAEKAERQRDEAVSHMIDAVNGKDTAWAAVWKKCESLGLLSFVGGDGTGLGRVLAFIDKLVRNADEWERLNNDNLCKIGSVLGCAADDAPIDRARELVAKLAAVIARSECGAVDRAIGDKE